MSAGSAEEGSAPKTSGTDNSGFAPPSDDTELHTAVNSGDVDHVRTLLNEPGVDVNARGDGNSTPLHLAVINNDISVVKLLLERDADIYAEDADHVSPWRLAQAAQCSLQILQVILKAAADLQSDVVDSNQAATSPSKAVPAADCGWALMEVAKSGGSQATEKLRSLLSISGDVSMTQRDSRGRTILHHAVANQEALQFLLESGRTTDLLEVADEDGCTALLLAAEGGYTESVSSLLVAGANREAADKNGQTALHKSAGRGHYNVVDAILTSEDMADGVAGLVDDIRDTNDVTSRLVNTLDRQGRKPLHMAAEKGQEKIVRLLLEKNTSINKTRDGRSPLDLAAESGSAETVETLISAHRQSLAWTDKQGDTPLHAAARKNHAHLIPLLLKEKEGLASKENRQGLNALDVAIDERAKDAAAAMGKHELWDTFLTYPQTKRGKDQKPQMYRMIKDMPEAAMAFIDRMVVEHKEDSEDNSDGGRVWKYDFMYLYTRDPRDSPLEAMIWYKRWQCLEHHVVVRFLKCNWQRFGVYTFMAYLLVYVIFMAILTATVAIDASDTTYFETHPSLTVSFDGTCHIVCFNTIAVFLMSMGYMVKEVYQIYQKRLHYLGWRNLLQWVLYLSAFLYSLPVSTPLDSWKTEAATVATMFGWLNFAMYLQRVPVFETDVYIYILLIGRIFKSLRRVILVFLLYTLAFTTCFYYIASKADLPDSTHFSGFHSFSSSFFTTLGMVMGELNIQFFLDRQKHSGVTLVLLVFFIFLMNIVIINLLIALTLDAVDIRDVRARAAFNRRIHQAEHMLDKASGFWSAFADRARVLTWMDTNQPSCMDKTRQFLDITEDEGEMGRTEKSPSEEQEDLRRRLADMEAALKTVSVQLKSMGEMMVQQSKDLPVQKA
ncbi:transient receptor potential cation channel subfamily A member 1-like [Branchiostoma floridae x Branchiostoma japonicum]